ncbi:TetR/AcrR family transcriptional regulator [Actinomadura roseirufa]|uniref:TetR/AcrR family transcriptional regulator n=1 Tax=Actinomadura roseirufa TaxID=2094049 RepID=UPI001040F338|nr:TetR/AcrR family transcriptional regulator [Actinomadura roseirufa]
MVNVTTHRQITDIAARLFGELGYDVTSLHMIAEAAGTDASTLREVAGDKRGLYLDVMRRAYEVEQAMLESLAESGVRGRTAVHQMVDGYLDFYLAHRENRTLWLQRWLSDAADITEMEDSYLCPMLRVAVDMITDEVRPGVDPYYVIGTLIWTILGYLGSGTAKCRPGAPDSLEDPEAVESFRAHLHTMMDGLLMP